MSDDAMRVEMRQSAEAKRRVPSAARDSCSTCTRCVAAASPHIDVRVCATCMRYGYMQVC